jgi:hypothetical protein
MPVAEFLIAIGPSKQLHLAQSNAAVPMVALLHIPLLLEVAVLPEVFQHAFLGTSRKDLQQRQWS